MKISRCMYYLQSNNLMFMNQFSFRPNKRFEQAIAIVTKQVYTIIDDEGKKYSRIYLNLIKAFDC